MSASDADSVKRELREEVRSAREHSERLTKLEALGTRAVACRHWRWMAGMLGLSTHSSSRSIWIRIVDPPQDDTSECWPDFSDPATIGCLLYLVREVGKTADVSAIRSAFKDGSVVWSIPVETSLALKMGLEDGFVKGATEAEALVAALEALP
jgi:hypothetical protein